MMSIEDSPLFFPLGFLEFTQYKSDTTVPEPPYCPTFCSFRLLSGPFETISKLPSIIITQMLENLLLSIISFRFRSYMCSPNCFVHIVRPIQGSISRSVHNQVVSFWALWLCEVWALRSHVSFIAIAVVVTVDNHAATRHGSVYGSLQSSIWAWRSKTAARSFKQLTIKIFWPLCGRW